jgi:glycogen debranching enzyme
VRPRLRSAPGGELEGRGPVELALTGARLHATVSPSGVRDVLVWGSGHAGELRFDPPLPSEARVRVTPNRIVYHWGEGRLTVAGLPRAPVVVLRAEGAAPGLRLVAPRRVPAGFDRRAALLAEPDGWRVASDWADLLLRSPGGVAGPRGRLAFGPAGLALLAAGADRDEAAQAAAGVQAAAAPEHELEAWQRELAEVLRLPDDELQGLFLHGLHAARSARKELKGGRFAGLAAGVGYAMPPRTYYRDGYWTLQALLPTWPEVAREQLLLLAREVTLDGEAPSGVVVASPAGERNWRARRATDAALAADHPRDGIWWADHTDAPLFFALLASEVAAWTGDRGLWATEVDGVTIGARVAAALERAQRSADASGLPVKPPHDRDWADNVFRGGHVTYDVGLYHGALVATAEALAASDAAAAARYRERARGVREAALRRLWREDLGHFVEFVERAGSPGGPPDGRAEAHLAIDTLTALRYGLADDARARRTLAAMRRRLETRHNRAQPYGDWGVMNVFPPYAPWVRRRGKSRFPYRYHDGADWPVWDGVYAEQRMRLGVGGWRYPLTRWWALALERGRATPFEYWSPPYGEGSPSNAWSSMPAAALLLGGFGLTPAGGARRPPWGAGQATWRRADGRRVRATASEDPGPRGLRLEVDDG